MELQQPQVFRDGGIPVYLYENKREPVEIRLMVRHGESAAALNALRCTFEAGPRSWNKQSYNDYNSLFFFDYDLSVEQDWAVIRMSCLSDLLENNWEVVKSLFAQESLDSLLVASHLESEQLAMASLAEVPYIRMDERIRRELSYSPLPVLPLSVSELEKVEGVEEVQAGWQALRRKEGLRLVIAGNVGAEQVGDLLFNSLANLPGDPEAIGPLPVRDIRPSSVHVVENGNYAPRIILVMQFGGGGEIDGALEVLAEVIGSAMRLSFGKDELAKASLEVGNFAGSPPSIVLSIDGKNAIPMAELVISELRKLKGEGVGEEAFAVARNKVLSRAMGSYDSNRSWADALSKNIANGERTFFQDISGIRDASPKQLSKLLQNDWQSINWFIVGDTAKVDENTLLRF